MNEKNSIKDLENQAANTRHLVERITRPQDRRLPDAEGLPVRAPCAC